MKKIFSSLRTRINLSVKFRDQNSILPKKEIMDTTKIYGVGKQID